MSLIIPHIPVLFEETVNLFKDCQDGYIIDCTLGYGGHSIGLLEACPSIKLICNDQDVEAIEFSKKRLKKYSDRIIFNKGNFKNIIEKYKDKNIVGILADVGVSSLQLDKGNRGFGFKSNLLDMRMDQSNELDAKYIVNNYSKNKLEYIFKEYGEVREYKKVANLIINNRPFHSAKQLHDLFSNNLYSNSKISPSTLPFQAIRIEVNSELESLNFLFQSVEDLKLTSCIMAIISFHSLEDRIVKNYFRKWKQNCICLPLATQCSCGNNNRKGTIITKKPIEANLDEIKKNPRSRSAKLRAFEFQYE